MTESAPSAPSSAQRKKLHSAADVCAHLKKTLDAMLLYERGHASLQGFFTTLLSRIAAHTAEFEDLPLQVSAFSLSVDGKAVFTAEKRDDAISHPLFLDGARRLHFGPGLELEELIKLMTIWRSAFTGEASPTHSLTTRFWEADFHHLRLVSVETFAEGSGEEESEQDSLRKHEDSVQALMAEIGGDRLAGGSSGQAARPKLLRVTREDLELLQMDAVAELTAGDLSFQDSARQAPASGLDEQERFELFADVLTAAGNSVERSLLSLSSVALLATPDELVSLGSVVAQIFAVLVRSGHMTELCAALGKMVAQARSEPEQMQARSDVLERFTDALETPGVLFPLVAALDDPTRARDAATALAFVPSRHVGVLLHSLQGPRTGEGRRWLSTVIGRLQPAGEEIAGLIGKSTLDVDKELLFIALALPPVEGWKVRIAALGHENADLRRAVVYGMKKEDAHAKRSSLRELIADPDAAIRKAMLTVFLGARDVTAVPFLIALLPRPLDAQERKLVLTALGTLGGDLARRSLRHEFLEQKDPDIKAACALAMGQAGDGDARPLLEAIANKMFSRGPLKDACVEALRRLDTRRGA